MAIDLRGLKVRPLEPAAPPGAASVSDLAAEAVDRAGLTERVTGRERVAVVVPDRTRKVPLSEILPVVLEQCARGGVSPEQVTIVVAAGTHPPAADEELTELLGPLPRGVAVVQHDSRDDRMLTRVGELRPGVPLRLSHVAVDADLVITVGQVQHHYFAGFGGGPKMIFPGIGGYEEIQANHARVIDLDGSSPRLNERCRAGQLEGNPLWEEIRRAARVRPADMAVCLVAGRDGRPCWCEAGPPGPTFAAAVEAVRRWYEVEPEMVPLAVVSAGGAPVDATLIQAHKALDAACRFVEPGGEVLLAARMERGAGSAEMEPFLEDPGLEAILRRLSERYVQYGHTALRIVHKARRFRISVISEMNAEILERMGLYPVTDASRVTARWRKELPGAAVGVMARGLVYPRELEHEPVGGHPDLPVR